jgi:hypothetical protein
MFEEVSVTSSDFSETGEIHTCKGVSVMFPGPSVTVHVPHIRVCCIFARNAMLRDWFPKQIRRHLTEG